MKISVVMQSYLSDYPGSRSNPEFKFTRAVHSFLSQTHEDKELIIVADGCEITANIYKLLYSNDARIKFCYVAKDKSKIMYQVNNGKKYYRGIPRKVGCAIATGDIITYMDSDDIMLPNRLSDLAKDWSKQSSNIKWGSNAVRFFHSKAFSATEFKESRALANPVQTLHLLDYGYDIRDEFKLNLAVDNSRVSTATYSLSHRRDIKATWQDCEAECDSHGNRISGISEDHLFLRQLMSLDDPCGFRQESPAYVICHYTGQWDV